MVKFFLWKNDFDHVSQTRVDIGINTDQGHCATRPERFD